MKQEQDKNNTFSGIVALKTEGLEAVGEFLSSSRVGKILLKELKEGAMNLSVAHVEAINKTTKDMETGEEKEKKPVTRKRNKK